ncbi:hypothetical protein F5Y18DRAFT_111375 [Xylariaceae sp. FL1019]|nr:hypothetical protein F5Y18DRAFT_111375 [Xylariaceae sp. FL1019]
MAMDQLNNWHWLDRYGKGYHAWVRETDGFARPLGLVEARFDTDGRYFEGRADVNPILTLGLSTHLSDRKLQEHILLAYTLLRLRHCLTRAKAELRTLGIEPWFTVRTLVSAKDAIEDAASALQFLPANSQIHIEEFHSHAQNVARLVDPTQSLSRAIVFPIESKGGTRRTLNILFAIAHQVVDGLSCMSWMFDFVRIMNLPTAQIQQGIESAVSSTDSVRSLLPPAQEDLYAPVASTKARDRWFWAITIILRHVKKPMPEAFPNPLRRAVPLSKARPLPQKYSSILDYSHTPPLNTFFAAAELSQAASQRLFRLCREAGASIGAGGFVLVAMVMMALHERKYPDEPAEISRPFIGSFPLNPRPFINTKCLDSVMLAFSEGIVLPFLPANLDLEKRFKLLVRQASRQLSTYQKRVRSLSDNDAKAYMGIRGAGRLIASNYIDGVEKLRDLLPAHLQHVMPSPQGEFQVPIWKLGRGTCGVSSIGKIDWSGARFDLDADPGEEVIASTEGFRMGVRVRDYEFLVGISSDNDIINASVSFDGNYIDQEQGHTWAEAIESLLEPTSEAALKYRL